MKKLINLSVLTLLLISCGEWDTSGTNVKTPDIHFGESTATKSQLELLREDFASDLGLMQAQINQSLDSYDKFQALSSDLKNKTGEGAKAFIELDSNFMSQYGKTAQEFQQQLGDLKKNFDSNKEKLYGLKNKIENNQAIYEQKVASFNSCKEKLETEKKQVESKINKANKELTDYSDQINKLKAQIAAKQKAVADNKRRRNRSNYPPDKKKYAKKAKKRAQEAQKLANTAKDKAKEAQSKQKRYEKQFNTEAQNLKTGALQCQNISDTVTMLHAEITKDNESFTTLKEKAIFLKNQIETLKEENADFLQAYGEYQEKRNELTKGAQKQLDLLAQEYEFNQEQLIINYGKDYAQTFVKLTDWLGNKQIDGQESIALIEELKIIEPTTKRLRPILEKMVAILKEASDKYSEVSKLNKNNYRSIATIFIKVDLSLRLPNLNLSDLRIDLPHIDLGLGALKLDLPRIDLPNLNVQLPNLNLQDINLGNIATNLQDIDIKIPQIDIVHLDIDVIGDAKVFVDNLRSIKIDVPEVELVRVEADVKKDLKAPGKILENSNREYTQMKANVDRELTRAYHDLKRETDKGLHDLGRETGKGLNKVGKALETAGQPENLARVALVYTASIYGGPLGSALANSLMDKLQNPGISDQELFNSFVIGAAAGYAAEGVAEVPFDSIQSMPSAASAIARNITTDAGNVLLNGKNYSTEQFLASIASGAVNVNTGDDFVSEVLDSALNSAGTYTVSTLAKKEKFDVDAFEAQLYQGLAQGLTRESIHAIIDEYVAKYIPEDHKRLDKKLIKGMGDMLADIFLAKQQTVFELQNQKFEALPADEKHAVINELNAMNEGFYEYLSTTLNKDVSELTFIDLSSEQTEKLYDIYINGKIQEAYNQEDSVLNKLALTREESAQLGRVPNNLIVRTLVVALTAYNAYQTFDEAKRINHLYEAYHKETGKSFHEFAKENPTEFASLTVDAALAIILPQVKLVSKSLKISSEVAVKVISSARKYLGVKAKKGLEVVSKKMKWKDPSKINHFFADIANPKRRNHILYGDTTGGGHISPGLPGKTPFPKDWSADKIMHEVSDIITDPKSNWIQKTGKNGATHTKKGVPVKYEVFGERDGSKIRVIIQPEGEGIITAHPILD